MTLLSMYERDDSRTVYRILADQAVKYLEHPEPSTDTKILFTNLVRLLERWRYDAFSDYVAPGVLEVLSTPDESQSADLRTENRRMEAVIPALEAAHARVYQSLSKEQLVETLQALLVQLASSAKLNEDDACERVAAARLFFCILSEGLREHPA